MFQIGTLHIFFEKNSYKKMEKIYDVLVIKKGV